MAFIDATEQKSWTSWLESQVQEAELRPPTRLHLDEELDEKEEAPPLNDHKPAGHHSLVYPDRQMDLYSVSNDAPHFSDFDETPLASRWSFSSHGGSDLAVALEERDSAADLDAARSPTPTESPEPNQPSPFTPDAPVIDKCLLDYNTSGPTNNVAPGQHCPGALRDKRQPTLSVRCAALSHAATTDADGRLFASQRITELLRRRIGKERWQGVSATLAVSGWLFSLRTDDSRSVPAEAQVASTSASTHPC